MHRNEAYECMYTRQDHCWILFTALCVDDLLMACERDSTIAETKNHFRCRLKMEDFRESRLIFEKEIIHDLNSKDF